MTRVHTLICYQYNKYVLHVVAAFGFINWKRRVMLEADIPNATDMLQQWSRGIHVQASLRRVFPASVVIDDADCCRANERTTACSLVTRLGNPGPSFLSLSYLLYWGDCEIQRQANRRLQHLNTNSQSDTELFKETRHVGTCYSCNKNTGLWANATCTCS